MMYAPQMKPVAFKCRPRLIVSLVAVLFAITAVTVIATTRQNVALTSSYTTTAALSPGVQLDHAAQQVASVVQLRSVELTNPWSGLDQIMFTPDRSFMDQPMPSVVNIYVSPTDYDLIATHYGATEGLIYLSPTILDYVHAHVADGPMYRLMPR